MTSSKWWNQSKVKANRRPLIHLKTFGPVRPITRWPITRLNRNSARTWPIMQLILTILKVSETLQGILPNAYGNMNKKSWSNGLKMCHSFQQFNWLSSRYPKLITGPLNLTLQLENTIHRWLINGWDLPNWSIWTVETCEKGSGSVVQLTNSSRLTEKLLRLEKSLRCRRKGSPNG